MRRIAIDLTPILPGGQNGGAKVMVIELVRELIRCQQNLNFILLTSDKNDAELAILDAPHVKRVCVQTSTMNTSYQFSKQIFQLFKRMVPFVISSRLKYFCHKFFIKISLPQLLKSHEVDLLYCPFTAPIYQEPGIPTVVTVYDLQYHDYPQFFSAEERYHRAQHFQQACQHADRLICISEYVRDSVLKNTMLLAHKVRTIPICLASRLPIPTDHKVKAVLQYWQLLPQQFLLYPANFWQHKNHEMLLTAFNLYRHQNASSNLKLVCTGAPHERMYSLQEAAQRMGIEEWVIFPGYLADEELAALMSSCLAVIFPSLYEGFGMPILEGMAWNKPVLCSNLTSMPEVAGGAAYLFDPRKPLEMVAAIQRVAENPAFCDQLINQGKKRLAMVGTVAEMAQQYVQVFQQVFNEKRIQMEKG